MELSIISLRWIYLVIVIYLLNVHGINPASEEVCNSNDLDCDKEQKGFDAISALHHQIDDDNDGNVDLTESEGFLREELQYTNGNEKPRSERQTTFHRDDKRISVSDLWKLWKYSEVYNWTVDGVVDWLSAHVELPQYSELFKTHNIDGSTLPRIAANSNYITSTLGIKHPVHKQKLTLKAMDVVLFGAPKVKHSFIKDLLLAASVLIATLGCWFAFYQYKRSQQNLKKMMQDMDTLQKAEDALTQMQNRLEKAQEEHQLVRDEKLHLENKMKKAVEESKGEVARIQAERSATQEEILRLKLAEEELVHLRLMLEQAEKQLSEQQWLPPVELQDWLQFTYEVEFKNYNAKKLAAEKQLAAAKEGCEKLRKKRSAFMGSLRIAHSDSIDEIDRRILDARAALEEVRKDLQERLHRWHRIEVLCGFQIVNNPGWTKLGAMLRDSYASGNVNAPVIPNPVVRRGSRDQLLEDYDDDTASNYSNSAVYDSSVASSGVESKRGKFYTVGLAAAVCTTPKTKRTRLGNSTSSTSTPPLSPTSSKNIFNKTHFLSPARSQGNLLMGSSQGIHGLYQSGQSNHRGIDLSRRSELTSTRSASSLQTLLNKDDSRDSGLGGIRDDINQHHNTNPSTPVTPPGGQNNDVVFTLDGNEKLSLKGSDIQLVVAPVSTQLTYAHSRSMEEKLRSRPTSLPVSSSESSVLNNQISNHNNKTRTDESTVSNNHNSTEVNHVPVLNSQTSRTSTTSSSSSSSAPSTPSEKPNHGTSEDKKKKKNLLGKLIGRKKEKDK
ncbi:stromal interaction molecule 1-like isoform X2 [Tubulanus polymorphus]|uniref:stromal interaction molecule 1-like isoform X2 n=1 Tax=Tubulanus polymorphus TaxID=672921 RepID=UPI003DA6A242